MKKILFMIGFFITGCAFLQVVIEEKSLIIDLHGISQKKIFQKSLQWITYSSVSGRPVLDYKDESTGRIVTRGNVFIGDLMDKAISVTETITIDCSDNRVRIKVAPSGCLVDINPRPCTYQYIGVYNKELNNTTVKLIDDYNKFMKGNQAPALDDK